MCYVHNQWYDISCATLYLRGTVVRLLVEVKKFFILVQRQVRT